MSGSSPSAIEQEIEHTRAHLDGTLDALADKLSPMHMISQLLSFTKAGGGQLAGAVAGSLASSARDNPMPVTLLTLGAGWLMMANRGASASSSNTSQWASNLGEKAKDARTKARQAMHDMSDRAQHTTQRLEEKMQDTAHNAQAKAHDMMDRAQDKAHDIMDRAQSKAQDMRRQLHDKGDHAVDAAQQGFAHLQDAANQLLEQNPIAAGALMVAIGALIGGSLPVTERERQLFGRTGEKVRDTAMKAMERGTEAVTEIAGKTLQETGRTVEKIGEEVRSPETAVS